MRKLVDGKLVVYVEPVTPEQEKAKKEAAAKAAAPAPAVEEEKEEPKAEITIDDFFKVDLVVGEIRYCEKLPKSDNA